MLRPVETIKTLSLMLAIVAGFMVHHSSATAMPVLAEATVQTLDPMVC